MSGTSAVSRLAAATAALTACRRHNAFVTELPERAAAQAADSDRRQRSSGSLGAVDGMIISVKDSYCIEGVKTTCGSPGLMEFVPPYTATVVAKLEALGAVTIGKTNLDEFGMGSFNINSSRGPVTNPATDVHPLAEARVSGGSSGGSAAAVAAGCGEASIGSDTGGSVRLPAAYCGVVGWKPSYGRSSRFGLAAFASSFDTPGVLSRTVREAAVVANAMSGSDPNDATCTMESMSYVPPLDGNLDGITVGIPREYHVSELTPMALRAWADAERWVVARGARVVPVSLPHTAAGLPAYYLLALAEASSNMARYDGVEFGLRSRRATECDTVREMITVSRGVGFGPEVKRRVLTGAFTLSRTQYDSYYVKAQRVRRLVCEDFARAFAGRGGDGGSESDSGPVHVLLTPTACGPAPTLTAAHKMPQLDVLANDVFTVPASLAGLPAISVPWGVQRGDDGGVSLPIGLQIIGPRGREEDVLRVAQVLEEESVAASKMM